jgi:hypothetical protein
MLGALDPPRLTTNVGRKRNMVPRIYADGNDVADNGCFMLHITGSLKDIERYRGHMVTGMRAVFNVQDEFEVEGVLRYDEENKMWLGCPDWKTRRDL